ncbi:MAG: aromatic hydrocarbon degradation protein [Betaproteobacteria bacterium HGW-Betaproteobacteria-7]|jgi:long-chain fatty acid transport protein|nr:MAG: aromatic hydrocarbon degradation protein [Betaproteobacteria bacterium HGW-Betaproteobacteria-7]
MQKIITPRLIPALLAIAFSGSAAASGFQLQNQTGSGNGTAFAGAAAAAEDAGTVFFNPAGMSYLPRGHNISLSGTVLHRVIDFSNKGSTTVSQAAFPLGTTNGGDGGGTSFLPHGYWVWGISQQLSVGLGIGPTFGNKTEYDFDFVGRNAGYFAEIAQININPSLSWKISDQVSIGGGINFAHNETQFKQGVPASTGLGFPANNFLDVKGDDWAIGYNLGAMFQVTKATRIGLTYRSELEFDLEGKQKFGTQVPGVLVNQDIDAKLKTPASASLAVSHMVNDRLELLADYTWTDWSVVDTIQLKSKQTGANLSALSYNFKDSWRVGIGANYQYTNDLKLRFGIAHDKAPVKSAADRTMTLPDTDRTWLSFGVKYKLSPKASVDVGYTHIFFAKGKTERAVDFPAGTTRQVIRGDWDNSVDIVSAQLNYSF